MYQGGTSQMGMAFLSHSSPAISFLCWQTRDEHRRYEETWRICLEGFWETSGAPAFAVQVGACRKNKGMTCFPSGTSTAAIIDDRTSEVLISPHVSPLLTTQKRSWGQADCVTYDCSSSWYKSHLWKLLFSPWRDWFLFSASFYHRLYQRMAVNTEAGTFCVLRGFKQSYVNWSMAFLKP